MSTNEVAERLRELVLAVARDEPIELYESPDELTGLFDKALAAERRATVERIRERLVIGTIQDFRGKWVEVYVSDDVEAILDEEAAR